LALLACCAALLALPFATAPGEIIADTKFELAVNPHLFLSGALQLWNPQQFGGLTDQYVGYLFPMGPFFELARIIGADGWIAQRLWLAALLITAFTGVVLLMRRMSVGTPTTRLAGGLAYALSPAALSVAGQTSIELLAMAMVPWMIVPLTDMRPWVRGARKPGGPVASRAAGAPSRGRAVARSALAIALCSGVNAASTLAVMVPCGLYILARPGTRVKARMLAWWLPAVVLITISWSVPLVLLSKYGVSFVPYTESAQVTSTTTSLLAIVRGTENWIGYQSTNGQPNRPLAFYFATAVLPAVLTGALAALGLAGLARRDMPERRFLLWSALGGIVVISLGYVSSLGSPLAGDILGLVNGPASSFRNLWKFDPMVRLPIAIGLAHLLAVPWGIKERRARAGRVTTRMALCTVAVAALASLAVPAATTGLASPGSFGQVPAYWTAAANWLNAHAGRQAVLVEPGAGFGEYTWGSPMDDVLAGLTNVDFAERNLATIGSVGNERLLNAIDQDITAGDGSPGLTRVLARMGIKYVLVRNDLALTQTVGTWPARVHDALAGSPGITLAAQFGPEVGGGSANDAVNDDYTPYPAVQIYHVAGAEAAAVVQPAASTLRVIGAPESLITLANENLLGDSPVLLNSDGAGQPVAGTMVTDTLRRRAVNFGLLRQGYSPTLTASEPTGTFLSTSDYTEPSWAGDLAVAQYTGIKDVTASSSAASITALAGQWATGLLPYAAFDGNAKTMWETGASYAGPLGQWIQADFDSAVSFGQGNDSRIAVTFADSPDIGPPVTRVTVSTAAGAVSDQVQITGHAQDLSVPTGPSGWLRITVTGLAPESLVEPPLGTQVGIDAIVVPGVSPGRTIVAPAVPAGTGPATVVLAKAQPYQSTCMLTSVRWVCNPELGSPTEEQYGFDQTAVESSPQQATLRGTAILTSPALIERYALERTGQPAVTASSADADAPQDQAWNAFDGNTATTWVASPSDPHPQLSISWGHPVTMSRLTVQRPPGASGLMQLVITGSDGQRRGALIGASGVARFAPMTTTSVRLSFINDQSPVQVSSVVIPGVHPVSGGGTVNLACGLGPDISVGGVTVPTTVTGSYAQLASGSPVTFTACEPVTLAAGATRVVEPASDGFDVQDVVLGAAGASRAAPAASPTPAASPATVLSWTSSRRTLRVTAATRSYLQVNENFNAGWRAVLDGKALQPVQLDGWKQAWVLPAGSSGVVTLTYAPAAIYRDALIAGLAALVLCAAAALAVPRRRRPLPWPDPSRPEAEPAAETVAGPERDRPRWRGRARRIVAVACLAATGLLLGGYPGAVLLPVATMAMLVVPALRGRRRAALTGWLYAAAAVVGAIGEHLLFSGDSGPAVSATSDAIPQVICLIVVGGLVAAYLDQRPEDGT